MAVVAPSGDALGHHHGLEAPTVGHGQDPGPQPPVGLGRRTVRPGQRHQRRLVVALPAGAGHGGQDGRPQLGFQVAPPAQAAVDRPPEGGAGHPGGQADHGAEAGRRQRPGT